jgi:hypothetical protein
MKKVEIYQNRMQGIKFGFSSYKKTYEMDVKDLDDERLLEEIYTIFNIEQPEDFKSYSLSINDIVKIDDTYYLCDSFGWTDVTDKI